MLGFEVLDEGTHRLLPAAFRERTRFCVRGCVFVTWAVSAIGRNRVDPGLAAQGRVSTHSRRTASVGTVGKHLFFDSILNRCGGFRQKPENHSWKSVSEWFGIRKPCL
jgi:hypothetical protein